MNLLYQNSEKKFPNNKDFFLALKSTASNIFREAFLKFTLEKIKVVEVDRKQRALARKNDKKFRKYSVLTVDNFFSIVDNAYYIGMCRPYHCVLCSICT